jgi:hypothetical protein
METSMLSPACGMEAGVCDAAGNGIARNSGSRQLRERMTFPFRVPAAEFYNGWSFLDLARRNGTILIPTLT